jgi:ribosomal protein S18 acetylase RimI-like enzyme
LSTIFLHPNHQRRGFGQLLIGVIQREAANATKPLLLLVIRINPAQRLYERVGFTIIEEEEKTFLMKWQAPSI